MELKEAQEILKRNIERKNQVLREIEELKEKMEKAGEAVALKLAQAVKEGKIQSGGYIATGEESEEFMNTLEELREFEENLYAGDEKIAYKDARLSYLDKFAELDSIDKEILFAVEAVERAQKGNEPGAENE